MDVAGTEGPWRLQRPRHDRYVRNDGGIRKPWIEVLPSRGVSAETGERHQLLLLSIERKSAGSDSANKLAVSKSCEAATEVNAMRDP